MRQNTPSEAAPVLSLGEALVEFMPPVGESMRQSLHWEKYAGGGPATFAAATARLGRPAILLTRVGSDPFSDFMLDALRQESVDISQTTRIDDRQIGLCFHECIDGETHLVFHRQHSAATTMVPEDLDEGLIKGAAALHVAGTTMQISQSAMATVHRAMQIAHQAGVPISFDPNLRTLLGGTSAADAIETSLAMATLVTPCLAEATAITGSDDPVQAARELRARGPAWVAVTLAGEGSVLIADDAGPIHIPALSVPVVEPTGSGDVHAAALLHSMLNGWDVARAGTFANAAGALAVTAMGHFGAALPTKDRIEDLLSGGSGPAT